MMTESKKIVQNKTVRESKMVQKKRRPSLANKDASAQTRLVGSCSDNDIYDGNIFVTEIQIKSNILKFKLFTE